MTRAFNVHCLRKRLIAPNVYELRLEKPAGFTFAAGQFVLFDVPLFENPTDMQTRAYSIASAPFESDLLFVIKLVPNGRASRWLETKLQEGDVIHLQGPIGRFLLKEDAAPLLMAATGTGVAPFRAQLLHMFAEANNARTVHLVNGVLSPRDFYWEAEWKALEQAHPNLHVHASFLSGEPDWHGETGSVQDRVKKIIAESADNLQIYLCGPPDLVATLKTLCLEECGVAKEYIHAESYV